MGGRADSRLPGLLPPSFNRRPLQLLMRRIGRLTQSIGNAPLGPSSYIRRNFTVIPPPSAGAPEDINNRTVEEIGSCHDSTSVPFDSFTRKRQNGKKIMSRSSSGSGQLLSTASQMVLKSSLAALPTGLLNPLLGPTEGLFPDMKDSFKRIDENIVNFSDIGAFPYPIDSVQLDEIRSVLAGFVRSTASSGTSGFTLPRVVTLHYAEAMGDALLEHTALGIARDLGADCLTFHARDFGGMLEGCARTWYGQPYFSHGTGKPFPTQQQVASSIMSEDDLELADSLVAPTGSSEKWLSQFLRRQPVRKGSSQLVPVNEAKIKESVNLQTILSFLLTCMERAGGTSPVRVIHLTGFSTSLGNPLHRTQILKFAQEANREKFTLVIVSENNPKADVVASTEESNAVSPSGMPLGLATFLLTKGRCERLAEIPNTPEYDANWLIDRNIFGGLRLFLVPPKDATKKAELNAMLEKDHLERVQAFNLRRISDVLDQLGMTPKEDITSLDLSQLSKSPLLLSEAIYLSYMAADGGESVSKASLELAISKYADTRALHKGHYTPVAQQNNHRLDVKSLSKYEKRLLPCIVTSDMVKTRFEDVGSHEKVKRSLYELITLPLDRPELFTSGILREAVSGILLFGPPGTGKTMLAKAVAAQSKSNFIAVNSSNIYDMYVGEGEKNVKALFKLARKLSPCIIFIDEVDAILDARSNAVGKASRVEILNEFMAEWDGLLSSAASARVMVMAATNRPFALDDAVLRRLPRRILVDLPGTEARLQILRILLKEDQLDPALDLALLAGPMTVNYSGSDLKNLCIAAAMGTLRRGLLADPSASKTLISMSDFEAALSEVPASISDSMDTLVELRKWDQMFGEGKKTKNLHSFGFAH